MGHTAHVHVRKGNKEYTTSVRREHFNMQGHTSIYLADKHSLVAQWATFYAARAGLHTFTNSFGQPGSICLLLLTAVCT